MTPKQAESQARLLRGTNPSHLEAERHVVYIPRETFAIGYGTSLIPLRFFDVLPEYSTSLPTGQRIGKKWRRKIPIPIGGWDWLLGEYLPDPDPGFVLIRWSYLRIAEAAILEGLVKSIASERP